MMDVSWSEANGHETTIRVCSAKPSPQVFASLGGARDCVGVDLHWVPELERSVPHAIAGCHYCRYPMSRKVYVPVVQSPLFFQRSIMREPQLSSVPERIKLLCAWPQRVLEIPPSAFAIIPKMRRGLVFAVVRGEGKLSRKVLFQVFGNELEGIPPSFDVKPFLCKAWGLNPNEWKGS